MTRVAAMVVALLVAGLTVHAEDAASPADAAWERLMEGNRAFVAGKDFCFDDIAARRAAGAAKQSPRVSIVACADSRVSPELLFHQSLGDLFIIRTAGNVVDGFALASLEYAATHDWTDLIVVLGHARCGAVEAALQPGDPPTPNLQALVNRIRESMLDIPYSAEPSPELLRRATEANAENVAAYISAHSSVLRDRIRSGRIRVAAAYYDLATGSVSRLPARPAAR